MQNLKVVIRFKGEEDANPEWRFHENGFTVEAPRRLMTGSKERMTDAKVYSFDRILSSDTDQKTMYDALARQNVEAVLNGANSTIFAYGQTGSGKTFSVLGPESVAAEIKKYSVVKSYEQLRNVGIIGRALDQMYCEFLVR